MLDISYDTSEYESVNKVEQNKADPSVILKELRIKNINRLVTAHLNIILSETKIDKPFLATCLI